MKVLRKMNRILVGSVFVATLMLHGFAPILSAADLPYTFSPGQIISAAQVNANFQALATQIAELQAQLNPASIAGTYDYFSFGIGMEVVTFSSTEYLYNVTRNQYRGTLVFNANGTFSVNGTGGFDTMEIHNSIADVDTSPGRTDMRSLISGSYRSEYPTDVESGMPYTLNGSTITVPGGFVGTFTADRRVLVGAMQSNTDGFIIAIRRP